MHHCESGMLWNKFGFILLGDQTMPDSATPVNINADPLSMHNIIKRSGKYNFYKSQFIHS